MLDVDHFKSYNDRYGHQAGDDCLRQLAQGIKATLRRPADLVARYGGEEFACILPDTPFDDAMTLALALERQVRAQKMPHDFPPADGVVTVSVGLAARTVDSGGDALTLVGLADAQLYRAKQDGRGRVCGATLDALAAV